MPPHRGTEVPEAIERGPGPRSLTWTIGNLLECVCPSCRLRGLCGPRARARRSPRSVSTWWRLSRWGACATGPERKRPSKAGRRHAWPPVQSSKFGLPAPETRHEGIWSGNRADRGGRFPSHRDEGRGWGRRWKYVRAHNSRTRLDGSFPSPRQASTASSVPLWTSLCDTSATPVPVESADVTGPRSSTRS